MSGWRPGTGTVSGMRGSPFFSPGHFFLLLLLMSVLVLLVLVFQVLSYGGGVRAGVAGPGEHGVVLSIVVRRGIFLRTTVLSVALCSPRPCDKTRYVCV